MPIEVKELVIKAVVGEKNKEVSTTALTQEEISKLKKEITKDVTEKVSECFSKKMKDDSR
ncbi:MAG: hypothetical protein IPL53_20925 [Ignavibacteria bacterium]|nr:hypothetical protein [Ignavibacteria bacterium]